MHLSDWPGMSSVKCLFSHAIALSMLRLFFAIDSMTDVIPAVKKKMARFQQVSLKKTGTAPGEFRFGKIWVRLSIFALTQEPGQPFRRWLSLKYHQLLNVFSLQTKREI